MVADVTATVTAKGGFGRDGGSGIILREDIEALADVISYLERRIQVCWAGLVAEALNTHQKKVDRAEACELRGKEVGRADHRIARELLHLLRNLRYQTLDGDHATQLRTLKDELWNKAIALVEQDTEVIAGLSGNLTERIIRSGEGVQAVFPAEEIEALPAVQEWVTKLSLRPTAEVVVGEHTSDLSAT
jgi:hypothetical protein